MNNDSIYPPKVIQNLFEHVWYEWRYENISDQQAKDELEEIAKWVNKVTDSKPNTEFWSKYF